MTLRDFLNSKVKSYEICLIYANHSTVAISWVFEESFSAIPEKYLNCKVKDVVWVMHEITIKDGQKQSVWFHRITIEENELVVKPEIPQSKYAVICDKAERIFYAGGYYEEIRHYSVIHTIPNNVAIYYGTFDTEEKANERCAELNKEWEEYFGEQK